MWRNFTKFKSTPPTSTSAYSFKISNNLLGGGPFITRFFSFNNKLKIYTGLFTSVEQGKGSYSLTMESFICPECPWANMSMVRLPWEMDHVKFRERNITAGWELGATFQIKKHLAITGNLNLLQFENYKRSVSEGALPREPEPGLYRNIYMSGSGFTHFVERPMFYLGVLLQLK